MVYGRCSERGMGSFSLIGLLVAAAIIVALAVAIVPRYTGAGAGTAPPGKAGSPVQRAEGVECMTNLTQLRQALTMYQSANEAFPASLQALGSEGVTTSMLACPVGGAGYAYQYDAQTGRVACRYPGHEQH